MHKRRIINLIFCVTVSVLSIVLLNLFVSWKYNHPNGFYRKVISHSVIGTGFVRLLENGWYIAGIDKDYVYLGNWGTLNRVLRVCLKNKATDTIFTMVNGTLRFDRGAYLRTNGKSIDLLDGNDGMILKATISGGSFSQLQRTTYFTAAIPLTSDRTVLRIALKGRQNTLVLMDKGKLTAPFTLEQQGEGLFSTDGMLINGIGTNKLFYVYYYRNQFMCFQDSLQILYKGRTIDTNTWAKIKIAQISTTHQLTIAAPPLFVNKQGAANAQWLFIASGLAADNEIKAELQDGYPVDVYAIKDGTYRSSFYLTNFDGEKFKDFRVSGNQLVGLFDHYLYFYQLSF